MKQAIFYISLILITSCINKEHFTRKAIEIRDYRITDTLNIIDKIEKINNTLKYKSSLKGDDFQFEREWLLPNPKDSINSKVEFTYKEDQFVTTLLAKKKVKIASKEINIIKYYVDKTLSIDEESCKYYTENHGIILETFWKRNFLKTIELNESSNFEINELIKLIIQDTKFLFTHPHQREILVK